MLHKPTFTPHKRTPPKLADLRAIYVRQVLEFYPKNSVFMLANGLLSRKSTKSDFKSWLTKFGRCHISKEPIAGQPFEYEHVIPLSLTDESKDIVWNIALVQPHRDKTKADKGMISKSRRVARKMGVDRDKNPIIKKQTMQSRGFYKHPAKKRTMSGKVVDR